MNPDQKKYRADTRGSVLLLVGHGSEYDDRSSRPVRRHAQTLRERTDFDAVATAFWKEEPEIEGAIERLTADEVVVLPMFTSQGYYAGRVVPEALGLDPGARDDVQQVDDSKVVYTEAFGTAPELVSIVQKMARECVESADMEPASTSIVLAGHGTPKSDRSSESTERLVEQLDETGTWGEVRAGFIDESPRIDQVVADAEQEAVVVVPFFVSNGGHASEDIPEMLGASHSEDFPVSFLGHRVHYTSSVGTRDGITSILEERARGGREKLAEHGVSAERGRSLSALMSDVGTGPRSSSDMTRAEAFGAFDRMLDGEPEPETYGAFLVANRWKSNTPEELGGFVDAMLQRRRTPELALDRPVLDCGANYDGKLDTLLLGVASGLVSAELGTPVAVHSAGPVPTKEGDTYRNVLEELDVSVPETLEESGEMLDAYGFGFFDQRHFLPDLADLVDRRRHVGVRTLFNTVETLANPAGAEIHLGSFYHLTYATKTINTFREARSSEIQRTVLFQGLEGYDDIRPGSTKVVVWEEGDEIRDFDIETERLGFEFDRDDLRCTSVAADSAAVTEEILAGDRRDHVFDAVCLNVGLRVYAAEITDSIEEGIQAARSAIEEGGPGDRLEALRG